MLVHEAKSIHLSPMDLPEEAFLLKSDELSRTTIPTQFCKLVEFYWTIRLFVAQCMNQRDNVPKQMHLVLKENTLLLHQID